MNIHDLNINQLVKVQFNHIFIYKNNGFCYIFHNVGSVWNLLFKLIMIMDKILGTINEQSKSYLYFFSFWLMLSFYDVNKFSQPENANGNLFAQISVALFSSQPLFQMFDHDQLTLIFSIATTENAFCGKMKNKIPKGWRFFSKDCIFYLRNKQGKARQGLGKFPPIFYCRIRHGLSCEANQESNVENTFVIILWAPQKQHTLEVTKNKYSRQLCLTWSHCSLILWLQSHMLRTAFPTKLS